MGTVDQPISMEIRTELLGTGSVRNPEPLRDLSCRKDGRRGKSEGRSVFPRNKDEKTGFQRGFRE